MAPEQKLQKVLDTLQDLKRDVVTIHKELHELRMNIEDSTLTEDDRKLLDEAVADKKAGRLIPLEDVRKKLNI